MKPADSFLLPGDVAVSLVGFIVVALGVAIVSEGLRTAWERAAAAEQKQAVPLGLIVNELVTNALKHAFPYDRSGKVLVVLKRGFSLHLLVEDNGVGCPLHKNERLGSRLTRLLAEQLGAKLAWEEASPGCRVRVEFPTP
jgi:two-component sensor histidine kinase